MIRTTLLVAGLVSLNANAALSQGVAVRSQDYLFLTNVADARALWVNPAGLALIPEASLFAEFTIQRTGSGTRVEQYSLGFNSRGVSIGYQRNRFEGESAVGILRTGLGFPFRRGTFGVAASRYSQDSTRSYGADLGVIYVPNVRVQLGLAVRNVGRPSVRLAKLPVTTVAAAQLTTSIVQMVWETLAAERRAPAESGFDFAHRAGALVALPTGLPVILLGSVDLGSNFRIDRLHFGFTIGGTRQVTAVASAVSRSNRPVFEQFSATLVAINPLTASR